MNKNLKIGLLLLILASVYFLCSAVAFFIMREGEKEKRLYLEEELREIVKSKDVLAKDLSQIKTQNRELESRLNSVKEQARSISEEILKEKEARRLLNLQLEEEKKKTERLMADVMTEKEERLALVHQLSSAEESYRQLKEQYNLMIQAKETLEAKLREKMASRGVELERIEVTGDYYQGDDEDDALAYSRYEGEDTYAPDDEETAYAGGSKIANVLVVNKKYNFVVTNIGKLDGVQMGSILDIYRDDAFIAKTKIEKLYEKMSAATILPDSKGARIREGDEVRIAH